MHRRAGALARRARRCSCSTWCCIAGFALTALAGYVLVYGWTGDRIADCSTGSMFAFNTHTLTRLAHVQGIHA